MSAKQNTILNAARKNGGKITKRQAIELLGRTYYCNEDHHVGAILSRMVNSGLLKRVKPGVFEIGNKKRQNKNLPETKEPTLFEI